MQNELLDILIIGCLVLLFASTYRKRATSLVRCWSIGWLLILVHFSMQLFHPASRSLQNTLDCFSVGGLIACAVLFLAPTGRRAEARTVRRGAVALAPAACAMLICCLVSWGVARPLFYLLLLAVGEFGALLYAQRFHGERKRVLLPLVCSVLACGLWLAWSILHARFEISVSAILTQCYLTVAIVYLHQFRRVSGGMLTMALGLFAWAAVFPSAEFCVHLGIIGQVNNELWNVPKYFVAFGMILVLLDDEIAAASAASRNYRLLFEANPHPMWIYDRQTLGFESVNDAAVEQYGYSREEFLKMSLLDVRPTEDFDTIVQEQLKAEPAQKLTGPWPHQTKDGAVIQVDIATQQMESDGRALAFSLMQNVTDRQKLHEQLVHQANHDILTGIPNRALLEERVRLTLAHAKRHGRHAALLCIDVDRFKRINDTYGHSVGDVCLKEIARRLAGRVRAIDTVARAGGEEFGVLLHEIDSVQDATRVAANLLDCINAPVDGDSCKLELTASIGIAVYPWDGQDADSLWRNADWAMYRAKNAGGNQFMCMSKEISIAAKQSNELELHIRQALKENGFELYYQPLYNTEGELQSLEALARLRHATHGIILPDRFIPVAEERGLIVPLGNWVLEEVCRQSTAWQREGLAPIRIGLNVSPLQLTSFDFAASVVDTLARYGLQPALLGMEVTETTVMRNIAEASHQISQLARMGVEFSVDDFGTGYSSLAHLHKLPVQTLKIDRSFVERIGEKDGTDAIVQAIIFLAHSLKMRVVAEGVETEEQLACLRRLDCDLIQGYLFSRPLPAAGIASLLRANQADGTARPAVRHPALAHKFA